MRTSHTDMRKVKKKKKKRELPNVAMPVKTHWSSCMYTSAVLITDIITVKGTNYQERQSLRKTHWPSCIHIDILQQLSSLHERQQSRTGTTKSANARKKKITGILLYTSTSAVVITEKSAAKSTIPTARVTMPPEKTH